jgi:NTP pyrophosphatase (non-canonical NTP hydrolase)
VSQAYLDDLQERLRQFAIDRDWEQFHAPKNLAMALAVEAGELMEHFQWLSEAQSETLDAQQLEKVGLEVADVFIFTVRLADRMGIDLADLVERKIRLNEKKYPAELVRGSSKKYTEYNQE